MTSSDAGPQPAGVEQQPGEAEQRSVPLLNVANALTAIRIIVVPVFMAFVIASEMEQRDWQLAACVAFCVAAATDYADGWIARTWNLVTSFGKIADPIADKALIGSALVLLSWYDRVPVWVTAVILVREFGVTALRFWVIRRTVIAASRGGKIKTSLQTLAVALCLAPLADPAASIGYWMMMVAMVATVVTGADYLLQALRVHQAPAGTPAPTQLPTAVSAPAASATGVAPEPLAEPTAPGEAA